MKRLGILQTDSVVAAYQSEFGDYPAMFESLLADADAEIVTVDVRQALPEAGFADGYVITGSKHSVYEDLPWIAALAAFVQGEVDMGRPVVGICFGHQLIAHFFGGEVSAAEGGWAVGAHETSVLERKSWMEPHASGFTILSSHQDQVKQLPQGAQLIASTPFCPVSGFVVDDKVLCLQGHPEFTKSYAGTLMKHRKEKLGEETFSQGMDSLHQDLDRELIAAWMLNFLGMRRD